MFFNLPYTNRNDLKPITQRLFRSAIRKRTNEKYKLTKDLQEITKDIKNVVTGTEWLVLEKSILRNAIIKTHEKKLKNLSKNLTLSYTSAEVITNLSNYHYQTRKEIYLNMAYRTRYHLRKAQ